MPYGLDIRIASLLESYQPIRLQLFNVDVTNFKTFQVRTIEGRLAGNVNSESPLFRFGSGSYD